MKLTVDMVAPGFDTEDVFGNHVSLKSHAGKLLLLSFFRNGACAIVDVAPSHIATTLLLSFFRNGACAMCNLQVHHLIQRFPEYHSRGLEVVAVFESPRESVLTHVSRQNAPFPIIADASATLYDLYDVETSQDKVLAPVDEVWRGGMIREAETIGYKLMHEDGSNFFRLPADFLIGPDGRIQAAFYSNAVGEHISWQQIDDALVQIAASSTISNP